MRFYSTNSKSNPGREVTAAEAYVKYTLSPEFGDMVAGMSFRSAFDKFVTCELGGWISSMDNAVEDRAAYDEFVEEVYGLWQHERGNRTLVVED